MSNNSHPNVFISSTHDDLVEYRRAVRDVLLELGFHPIMMEYFSAMDVLAVRGCMDKVDSADIYVGIFAHKYGFCPEGSDISITEMEFDRATTNGIPRLCFVVDESHVWLPHYVDSEPVKSRLNNFKLQKIDKLIRAKFTTPDNLAMQVAVSLIPYVSRAESVTGDSALNGAEQVFERKSLVVYGLEATVAMNELRLCMERLSGLANTFNMEVDRNSTKADKSDPDHIKFERILSASPENLIQLALPIRGQNLTMRLYWRIFAINSINVISFIDPNKPEHISAINGFKFSALRSLDILNIQKNVFRKLYALFKDSPVTDSDFDYGVSQVTQVFSETISVINDGISVSEEIIRVIEKF